jgi:hypothetical protein
MIHYNGKNRGFNRLSITKKKNTIYVGKLFYHHGIIWRNIYWVSKLRFLWYLTQWILDFILRIGFAGPIKGPSLINVQYGENEWAISLNSMSHFLLNWPIFERLHSGGYMTPLITNGFVLEYHGINDLVWILFLIIIHQLNQI